MDLRAAETSRSRRDSTALERGSRALATCQLLIQTLACARVVRCQPEVDACLNDRHAQKAAQESGAELQSGRTCHYLPALSAVVESTSNHTQNVISIMFAMAPPPADNHSHSPS